MRPWVLALGLVGVVGLIAMAVYLLGGNIGGTETADLPNVVGQPRNEAEEILKSKGFDVKVKTEESAEESVGKVVEQYPSGGEAEKGSMVAITVGEGPEKKLEPAQDSGPAPGYNSIQDPTGALTIEVPPSWGVDTAQDSEGTERNWSSVAGYTITSSVTTAPSLNAWYSPQPATGAYIVASRELAQSYTNQQLLYSGPWANWETDCAAGPYENFDRFPYSGKKQTWYCPSGRTFYHVAAAPEERECVVLLQLGVPTQDPNEADRKAIQHILDTFDADCGNIAKADVVDRGLAEVARVGAVA